jgi:hypothetical protein
MVTEASLTQVEKGYAEGLTSAQLLAVFADWNVPLSEATLRKYVQLGLLPRSVRVGRKGKHSGSQGIYPVGVVRQILHIRAMMADNYTIEQIQREFFFVRNELRQLEQTLSEVFSILRTVIGDRRHAGYAKDVSRDLAGAQGIGKELLSRLYGIESRLTTRAELNRVSAS